ncbi:MAG TPA: winged helix-turn-helix domain-containing protein [Pyrinomonadaceae bacterium]|nr:winged helix-turn-helix domain-containing protein [Pyrinomonadaceae bacterium]
MSRESSEVYEFGEFRLDVGERKVERRDGSRNGSLPEKSFQTLVHLVRNNGSLVPKEELLAAVWPDTIVEENNLGKAIHSIRNFFGEGSGKHEYVETVPKHGYRFVAAVTTVSGPSRSNDGNSASRSRNSKTVPIRSQAYDLYLRGKLKAGSENREDTDAAIKILEAAIAIDPNLAGAYAQLARAYNTLAFKFSSNSDARLYLENAEVAILKALALDPDLAEAHFARGLILWTKSKGFPHEQAIRSYQRSLALDPDSDETHHQLSMVYSHIGLLDEAQVTVHRALEINPNNTMARFRVGVYTAYQGKFDDAIAVFKTIPRDVSPILVDRCTAEALVQSGNLTKAERIVDQYLDMTPRDEGGSFTSVKAVLLAKAGVEAKAEEAINRAAEIGQGFGHFHHTAHNIASALAAMNKPDQAVEWLERAADDGFPNHTYFQMDPNLDPIRRHPAFVKLMSRLQKQLERFKALV